MVVKAIVIGRIAMERKEMYLENAMYKIYIELCFFQSVYTVLHGKRQVIISTHPF